MFMMTPPCVMQAASCIWLLIMNSNSFISRPPVRAAKAARLSAPAGTVSLAGSIQAANAGSLASSATVRPSNTPKFISRRSCSSMVRTPGYRISAVCTARSSGEVNTTPAAG